MNLLYLQSIRLLELEHVLSEIKREKPGINSVLEIGAGTGWQAKRLTEHGHSVEAIDINTSKYSKDKIWPITVYDGKRIPFPDSCFDIVFSSNVLEHIRHVISFQNEIKRVLKTDGVAIHVLPSGTWRFWTNVAHYPYIFKTMIDIIAKRIAPLNGNSNELESVVDRKIENLSSTELLKQTLFPSRHGEIGNPIMEIYYFSKYRWKDVFLKTGWKIEKILKNRLFYTGYVIFGSVLSLKLRKNLSCVLGSSCHVFVLKKKERR